MNKTRVLIVDDEYLIIQGLQVLIDWDACGCEIVGSATDGSEGLELIRKLQPDIVITDIRMPNMVGIEMIRNARQYSKCRFIILSGYSDFNYARQCMALGVQEYLLKPVEEELLMAALERLRRQQREEAQQENDLRSILETNEKMEQLSSDYFLRDFVNMYFTGPEDFASALERYAVSIPQGAAYTCALLQLSGDAETLQACRAAVAGSLQRAFPEHFVLFLYQEDSYMTILALEERLDSKQLMQRLTRVKAEVAEAAGCCVNIGVGDMQEQPYRISLAAKQAEQAMAFRIVRGEESVNSFSSGLDSAHFIKAIPKELLTEFGRSVTRQNHLDIGSSLRQIFAYLGELKDMPLLGVQISALHLILVCIRQIEEMGVSKQPIRYENMNCFDQIAGLTTVDQIGFYVENVVYNLIHAITQADIKKTSELIVRVQNFIHDHIYEDLSLISVAESFYVSPTYLSRLFKKETGKLYIDYVTTAKMNEARQLLLMTNLMVYEVAQKLGYKDTKYFTHLYKANWGETPGDSRRKA